MSGSKFLEYFCGRGEATVKHDDEIAELLRPQVADEEVEGECIDLCLQYLNASRENPCPPLLALHISQEVANTVHNKSLSKLRKKSPDSKLGSTDAHSDVKKDSNASSAQDVVFDGIDASELAQEVLRITKEVCLKYKAQPPSFVTTAPKNDVPLVSEHAIKNTRRKMEDRHVIMPYLSKLSGLQKPNNSLQFYAVYDGHGGIEAAKYASTHLHCNLAAQLQKGKGDDIKELIKKAFFKTDELFVQYAERENIMSGTTAVCAVLEEDQFHIAWLGDSQALLVRDGKPVELMQPHKPEREDEKKRIEALGGYVVWFGAWRVNGNLSVSRAIGDANFKPYISAEPDVATFERQASDEYLVLACDGLWDALNPTELVEEVQQHIKSGTDKTQVAKKLTEVARDKGSSDNITVVIVFFKDGSTSTSVSREGVKKEHAAGGKHGDDGRKSDGGGGQGATPRKPGGDAASLGSPARGSVNKDTENSHLGLGIECSSDDSPGMKHVLENDSSEADSSGDVHALSGDSTKNVLDPLKIHSSDDTNGDPDFGATGYNLSPPSNQTESKSHGSDDSISLEDSQRQSDASARSFVGIRDVPHRPRRRRTSRKENRRPSRDKLKTATPPCVHSISADRKQLDISFRESCRSLSQTSSHLLKMLTGLGARSPPQRPSCGGLRSTNKDRWTIAVEVEDWAAMFESNKPIETTQAMNLSTHW